MKPDNFPNGFFESFRPAMEGIGTIIFLLDFSASFANEPDNRFTVP